MYVQYNSIAWYKLQLVYPSSTFTCNFNIANRNRTGRFFPLRRTFVIRLPVEINHHYVSRARKEGTFGGPDRMRLRTNPLCWPVTAIFRGMKTYVQLHSCPCAWSSALSSAPSTMPLPSTPCSVAMQPRHLCPWRTRLLDAWNISDIPAKPIPRLVALNQPSLLRVGMKISSPDSVVSAD